MSTSLPMSHQFIGDTARDRRDILLARVERRIHEFLTEERREWAALNPDSTELIDCVARMVGSGGKRLRPAFCIAGYLAGGGDPDAEVIVDVAAALELLHTFALLHDDVMDDSGLRRNEPTAHMLHSALHEERDWRGAPPVRRGCGRPRGRPRPRLRGASARRLPTARAPHLGRPVH